MGLIGGALSAVGSIFGGISASKAMKKVKQNLNNQMKDNQNWYDRRYNEDMTQRADAQAVLQRAQDSIKARNQQAAGAQAVMGGTDESTAATKAANNEALANATSAIAANAAKNKDNIESKYLSNKSAINDSLNNTQVAKAQAIANAAKGVGDAAGNIEDGWFGINLSK